MNEKFEIPTKIIFCYFFIENEVKVYQNKKRLLLMRVEIA